MINEDCFEPKMRKFLAFVKVEIIQEPIRNEEYAANLKSLKQQYKSFTFLMLQEDV